MSDCFPLYEFAGEPYELGRAYGETLTKLIHQTVADTFAMAAAAGENRAAALAWSAAQLPKIARLAPHLVEELRGIADGARLALDEVVAIQVRPGTGRMRGGCTAIAAAGAATIDGRPLGAQNRDLFPGTRAKMVLTLLRPQGRRPLLMHSVPGELGGTGFNGDGLALFANSLGAKNGRNWMGTPVLRRVLLETADADAAVAAARSLEGPAVGSFLLVDAAGKIRNLEILPERVAVIARDAGTYAHTNHCHDATQQDYELQPLQYPGSIGRCRTMDRALAAVAGRIDVEQMKLLLSQHEPAEETICRHSDIPTEHETAATSIVEPATRTLHISYGPPCEGRFTTYSL
ncbi:MAG: C45 family peptidase [Planctomycetia bacterium]|nr:C45 family peptidase [Planctomycetia bacterium]